MKPINEEVGVCGDCGSVYLLSDALSWYNYVDESEELWSSMDGYYTCANCTSEVSVGEAVSLDDIVECPGIECGPTWKGARKFTDGSGLCATCKK